MIIRNNSSIVYAVKGNNYSAFATYNNNKVFPIFDDVSNIIGKNISISSLNYNAVSKVFTLSIPGLIEPSLVEHDSNFSINYNSVINYTVDKGYISIDNIYRPILLDATNNTAYAMIGNKYSNNDNITDTIFSSAVIENCNLYDLTTRITFLNNNIAYVRNCTLHNLLVGNARTDGCVFNCKIDGRFTPRSNASTYPTTFYCVRNCDINSFLAADNLSFYKCNFNYIDGSPSTNKTIMLHTCNINTVESTGCVLYYCNVNEANTLRLYSLGRQDVGYLVADNSNINKLIASNYIRLVNTHVSDATAFTHRYNDNVNVNIFLTNSTIDELNMQCNTNAFLIDNSSISIHSDSEWTPARLNFLGNSYVSFNEYTQVITQPVNSSIPCMFKNVSAYVSIWSQEDLINEDYPTWYNHAYSMHNYNMIINNCNRVYYNVWSNRGIYSLNVINCVLNNCFIYISGDSNNSNNILTINNSVIQNTAFISIEYNNIYPQACGMHNVNFTSGSTNVSITLRNFNANAFTPTQSALSDIRILNVSSCRFNYAVYINSYLAFTTKPSLTIQNLTLPTYNTFASTPTTPSIHAYINNYNDQSSSFITNLKLCDFRQYDIDNISSVHYNRNIEIKLNMPAKTGILNLMKQSDAKNFMKNVLYTNKVITAVAEFTAYSPTWCEWRLPFNTYWNDYNYVPFDFANNNMSYIIANNPSLVTDILSNLNIPYIVFNCVLSSTMSGNNIKCINIAV